MFAWALTLGFASAATSVMAQTPPATPSPEARAETAFGEAMEAWRRGDCRAAADGFGRAFALVAHPHTRYNLARAWECAGEVALALEAYERFSAESVDASDRVEVSGRIAALRARPVEVFLTSEPLDAAVSVDGNAPSERTPCHLRLTPGAHVIVLTRVGHRPDVRRVVVDPGVSLDVHASLVALPPVAPTPPQPDRVNTRRAGRMFSGRAGVFTGFSVPRDRPVFAVGVEGGVFYHRSLSLQAYAMWIDTDGSPFTVGGDVGWVFTLDEVDLGIYLSGAALLQCETSCREDTFRRDSEQFIGGFAVRADVVLHPRLGVGLFARAAWRNFELTNSEALLATGGLSVSLFL